MPLHYLIQRKQFTNVNSHEQNKRTLQRYFDFFTSVQMLTIDHFQ